MRKLISATLVITLLLTVFTGVCSTTVSAADADGSVPAGYAPEGTAIRTAEEFAAMTADGKYYLAADVTLTASYAAAFSGTLDGNGKTVTLSAPMFLTLNGATVKNLKTVGQIDYADYAVENAMHVGAVAAVANLSTLENLVNEASVYGAKSGYKAEVTAPDASTPTAQYGALYTGGLVGLIVGTTTVKGCTNRGNVTAFTPGGIVGGFKKNGAENSTVTFEQCVNYGAVSDTGCVVLTETDADGTVVSQCFSNAGAGILAYANAADAGNTVTDFVFESCANYGNVSLLLEGPKVGGIFGYIYDVDNGPTKAYTLNSLNAGDIVGWNQVGGLGGWSCCNCEFIRCENNGSVWSRNNYAGGIVARPGFDANTSRADVLFERCSNTGDVVSHRQYAAGIFGYTANDATIKYCFNSGTLKAEDVNNFEKDHGVRVAGIAANVANTVNCYSCINTGNMEGNALSGGIIGRAGRSGNTGFNTIESCVNSGNVWSSCAFSTYYSDGCVGGMIGYTYGSSTGQFPIIRGCISVGTITAEKGIACGLAGYFNTEAAVLECNYIGATITGADVMLWPDGGFSPTINPETWLNVYVLCWNNKSYSQYFESNYVPVGCDYLLCYQKGIEYTLDNYEWVVTPEQVLSGELAYKINEDFGEYTLVWQEIGVDALPKNCYDKDYEKHYVEKDENGNFINVDHTMDPVIRDTTEVKVEETTAAETLPNETTAQVTDEATTASTTAPPPETTSAPSTVGCSGAIGTATALVLVALLAPAGIMLKKKE